MIRTSRTIVILWVVASLLAGVVLLALATTPNAARAASPVALAKLASTTNAVDTAKLHYIRTVHHAGRAFLLEEGTAHGTLPGSMRASLSVEGTFSGSFTLYLRSGTITGRGTARPHGSGIYESFSGKLTVTGGTGRYSHAHGNAGLYGTFNRHTYALVVQTTGTLGY